jgi:hypothetical protein
MSESLSVKKLNGFEEESEIPCPPSSGKWVSIDEWLALNKMTKRNTKLYEISWSTKETNTKVKS